MGADDENDGKPIQFDHNLEMPLAEQLIEHLIDARDVAIALEQDLLKRLIEAVMLEAGRTFAQHPSSLKDGN